MQLILALQEFRPSQAQAASAWLAVILLAVGCSGFIDPAPDEPVSIRTVELYRQLPEEFEELQALVLELYREGAQMEDMAAALVAACKAITLRPLDAHANHQASKSCNWLMDFGEVPYCYNVRRHRTEQVDCSDFGKAAARLAPDNAEYHYYLALSIGLEVRHASIAEASLNIKTLMSTLERVIELDAGFDQGGALRILGALYTKAPPWPTGPGDLDKSLALLQRAVEDYPEHPLNQLFYAEALLEDEELEEAREKLAEARRLLDPARFLWRTKRFLKMCDKLEKRLKEAEQDQ